MMIGVAYFAVIFAVIARPTRNQGEQVALVLARAVILLTPWVLAGLIGAFEKPGPVKNWAVLLSLFLFYPAIALYVDLAFAVSAWETGSVSRLWTLVAFNALIGGSSCLFFRHMAPARCPSCSKRAMIPLVKVSGQSPRLGKSRWCGACHGQFWRDASGSWCVEKRHTWVSPESEEEEIEPGFSISAPSPPIPNRAAAPTALGSNKTGS
jgi:hypothetical protein